MIPKGSANICSSPYTVLILMVKFISSHMTSHALQLLTNRHQVWQLVHHQNLHKKENHKDLLWPWGLGLQGKEAGFFITWQLSEIGFSSVFGIQKRGFVRNNKPRHSMTPQLRWASISKLQPKMEAKIKNLKMCNLRAQSWVHQRRRYMCTAHTDATKCAIRHVLHGSKL